MPVNLKNNPPNHVAILMDGNGRWAQARSHSRVWGHIRGVRTVSKIVEEADDCGVKALTMYAFSTENWSRPLTEVKTLFSLLTLYLQVYQMALLPYLPISTFRLSGCNVLNPLAENVAIIPSPLLLSLLPKESEY